jgi:thiol-disulfide isomerase/thioredoxin
MTTDQNQQAQCDCGSRKRLGVLMPVLLLGLVALCFRGTISRRLAERALLSNDAPSEEQVSKIIQDSADPVAALLAEWNTGKIVPRELAIRVIDKVSPRGAALPPGLEEMLLAGALDPDENVRETALGQLSDRLDPAMPGLVAAELTDLDPEIRLLGLQYLKRMPGKDGLPICIHLLNDLDPRVAGSVLSLMNTWYGQDFGVKLRDISMEADPKTGFLEFLPDSVAKVRASAERAKAWVREHGSELALAPAPAPSAPPEARRPVPSLDFSLRALDGHSVRLSDFRGKVVVLNFWTTWCTACVTEMPELIDLQERNGGNVVILGTSLDFTPDDDEPDKGSTPEAIRAKVARTVQQRGVNYTVLLDEAGKIGARYNGGELPTTLIIDKDGNVRRRFVGARGKSVFDAFIAEASRPL